MPYEATHLAKLTQAGRRIVEVARGDLAVNAEETPSRFSRWTRCRVSGAFLSEIRGGWSDLSGR